jgi:hypothetical protein
MHVPLLPVVGVPDKLKEGFNRKTFTTKLTPHEWAEMLEWLWFLGLEEVHYYRDWHEDRTMGNGDGE